MTTDFCGGEKALSFPQKKGCAPSKWSLVVAEQSSQGCKHGQCPCKEWEPWPWNLVAGLTQILFLRKLSLPPQLDIRFL